MRLQGGRDAQGASLLMGCLTSHLAHLGPLWRASSAFSQPTSHPQWLLSPSSSIFTSSQNGKHFPFVDTALQTWLVPYHYFLLGGTFGKAVCFVVQVPQSRAQHTHLGAGLLSGSGKKSPFQYLEHKGFVWLFIWKEVPFRKDNLGWDPSQSRPAEMGLRKIRLAGIFPHLALVTGESSLAERISLTSCQTHSYGHQCVGVGQREVGLNIISTTLQPCNLRELANDEMDIYYKGCCKH